MQIDERFWVNKRVACLHTQRGKETCFTCMTHIHNNFPPTYQINVIALFSFQT